MPPKVYDYAQLAEQTAGSLTRSYESWTDFLSTASRLYKYPYADQLLIYAQRPDATACASYDLWNSAMRRYVRRGAKGIALLDTSGDYPRLRYVFDVSDTGIRNDSRYPYLWQLEDRHQTPVSQMLSEEYALSPSLSFADKLEQTAAALVQSYWREHERDIRGIVDGSLYYRVVVFSGPLQGHVLHCKGCCGSVQTPYRKTVSERLQSQPLAVLLIS